MNEEISRYLLKLRRHHPFLATISMFAEYQFTDKIERFDTDGKRIRINSSYYQQLPEDERIGTLMHTTLHSALLHPIRRGMRNEQIWNIAADIVVNDIINEAGVFKSPTGTAVEPEYHGLSVEQVYERLKNTNYHRTIGQQSGQQQQKSEDQAEECDSHESQIDVTSSSQDNKKEKKQEQQKESAANANHDQQQKQILMQLYNAVPDLKGSQKQQAAAQKREQKEIQNYWQGALKRAQIIEQLEHHKQQGHIPAGLLREIETLYRPQLDWRTLLWRFMSRTPCDFVGFDRRFLYQQLYLDQLEGESLKVYIAVDTSGSVTDEELAQFITEVRAILSAYHHIQAKLYYVDADIYGPYDVTKQVHMPPARGGGGTEFTVFFAELEKQHKDLGSGLCIYLTDGYSDFPIVPPKVPVLWVISHGGMESDIFPFGEVARLSAE